MRPGDIVIYTGETVYQGVEPGSLGIVHSSFKVCNCQSAIIDFGPIRGEVSFFSKKLNFYIVDHIDNLSDEYSDLADEYSNFA